MVSRKRRDRPTIYWSKWGEVMCEEHAPAKSSENWTDGEWKICPFSISGGMCQVCEQKKRKEAP